MIFTKKSRRIIVLFFALSTLAIFLASCKDDPLEPDMDHFEAEGLVLYQSGIKVAEILEEKLKILYQQLWVRELLTLR